MIRHYALTGVLALIPVAAAAQSPAPAPSAAPAVVAPQGAVVPLEPQGFEYDPDPRPDDPISVSLAPEE